MFLRKLCFHDDRPSRLQRYLNPIHPAIQSHTCLRLNKGYCHIRRLFKGTFTQKAYFLQLLLKTLSDLLTHNKSKSPIHGSQVSLTEKKKKEFLYSHRHKTTWAEFYCCPFTRFVLIYKNQIQWWLVGSKKFVCVGSLQERKSEHGSHLKLFQAVWHIKTY